MPLPNASGSYTFGEYGAAGSGLDEGFSLASDPHAGQAAEAVDR
jgi:hypothetical protein